MSSDAVSRAKIRRDAALCRLRAHVRDCEACQHVGGEDAPRSSLCPRGDALYEMWERVLSTLASLRVT